MVKTPHGFSYVFEGEGRRAGKSRPYIGVRSMVKVLVLGCGDVGFEVASRLREREKMARDERLWLNQQTIQQSGNLE